VVLLEGEPCAGLQIVESGWLKVVKIGVDGREQVLRTLEPGDVFNAISVFTPALNQATVSALEDSQVWTVRREALLSMIEQNHNLARQVIQDLAERAMHLVHMVEDLSLYPVEARLARLLLTHAQDQVAPRRQWATQAEIAARLGTVPDVVNRILRKLSEEGVLQVDRRQIRILDQDRLKSIAQALD
jgi:CRP/FNR family transcriptional regulator